jgi:hypothetical protein
LAYCKEGDFEEQAGRFEKGQDCEKLFEVAEAERRETVSYRSVAKAIRQDLKQLFLKLDGRKEMVLTEDQLGRIKNAFQTADHTLRLMEEGQLILQSDVASEPEKITACSFIPHSLVMHEKRRSWLASGFMTVKQGQTAGREWRVSRKKIGASKISLEIPNQGMYAIQMNFKLKCQQSWFFQTSFLIKGKIRLI